MPALLYPSGCAFKFPHLLLFTLSSSRAGTLSKIHTRTCAHACTYAHTHVFKFYLCADDAVLQLCEAHTRHCRGIFSSLPPFSFSKEQAKSRGSAGLWRVGAANFLWALWSLPGHPWRLNQRWCTGSERLLLRTRGQICIRILFSFNHKNEVVMILEVGKQHESHVCLNNNNQTTMCLNQDAGMFFFTNKLMFSKKHREKSKVVFCC